MSDSQTDDPTALIEQYKFYAGTSSEVSDRRLRTNRFYVSLLSGILVALPFVLDFDDLTSIRLMALLVVGFVGVTLCVTWYFNILSYKQLNAGKYEVVHEIEEELPYACFTREWEVLEEGTDRRTYLTHWRVERLVPWVLAIPYLAMAGFAVSSLLG